MKFIKTIACFLLIFLLASCVQQTPKPDDSTDEPQEEKETVSVIFSYGHGMTASMVKVEKGGKIEKPEDPVYEGYVFKYWYTKVELDGDESETINREWNFEENTVSEQTILYAKWEKVEAPKPVLAVINLVTEDGEVVKTFEHVVGETIPLYYVNKVAKGYEITGYTYNGEPWDLKNDVIPGDMDLVMSLELITYKIKYYYDGKLLEGLEPSEYTVESSASIDLPNAPEVEGYEFIGWFFGTTRVVTFFSSDAEDKEYTAKYQKIKTEEDLMIKLPDNMSHQFTKINKTLLSDGKNYVYQPELYGLNVPTGVTNYTWTSLNPEVVTISQWSSMSVVSAGYAVIQAVNNNDKSIVICCVVKATADGIFISTVEEANTKVSYQVTFVDEAGEIIEVQTVEQYKNAILPTPPAKDGWTFVGWDKSHVNITSDTTIGPTYIEGTSDFAGKTVSILGDSISTFKNYVPDGYACFYPYPSADVSDVNYTWWMRTINKLGMKLLKNNSYSGSCVSAGTGASGATNDSRLVELTKGTERPDIILIFMGANDCGSSNVTLKNFQISYQTMLDKIINLCPESEIYLITLPSTGLYKESDRLDYNVVIRNYAASYNLGLIDLGDLYTTTSYKDYVVDSCHPNNAGMVAISNAIVEALLKELK